MNMQMAQQSTGDRATAATYLVRRLHIEHKEPYSFPDTAAHPCCLKLAGMGPATPIKNTPLLFLGCTRAERALRRCTAPPTQTRLTRYSKKQKEYLKCCWSTGAVTRIYSDRGRTTTSRECWRREVIKNQGRLRKPLDHPILSSIPQNSRRPLRCLYPTASRLATFLAKTATPQ